MDQSNQLGTLKGLAQAGQQQDLVLTPEIKGFLDGILIDGNMTSLDEQMHEEMLNQLYVSLDRFLISRMVEIMPEEQLEGFISLQEKGAPKQEVEEYIQKHVPNAQQVFIDAFKEFRELYLTNVAVSRNAPGGPTALVEAKKEKE